MSQTQYNKPVFETRRFKLYLLYTLIFVYFFCLEIWNVIYVCL